MKKEKKPKDIDIQDYESLYENLVFKFICLRQEEEERERRVIIDKISLHTKGKEVVLENSR